MRPCPTELCADLASSARCSSSPGQERYSFERQLAEISCCFSCHDSYSEPEDKIIRFSSPECFVKAELITLSECSSSMSF